MGGGRGDGGGIDARFQETRNQDLSFRTVERVAHDVFPSPVIAFFQARRGPVVGASMVRRVVA